jgi:hypothetical protein
MTRTQLYLDDDIHARLTRMARQIADALIAATATTAGLRCGLATAVTTRWKTWSSFSALGKMNTRSLRVSAIVAIVAQIGAGWLLAESGQELRRVTPTEVSDSTVLNALRDASASIVHAYDLSGDGAFLCVTQGSDSSGDYGLRLQLIELRQGKATLKFSSRGMNDSYVLQPMTFVGQDRILILAETGAEYSWGLAAFELRDGNLRDLGDIDVAGPESESSAGPESPLPFATARYVAGDYEVAFATELVFDPGGTNEALLRRTGERPLVVRHGPEGWQLVGSKHTSVR